MALHKITLMEAYLIETLRQNNVKNEEMIKQVAKKDVSEWEHLNEDFDFNQLINLYEQDEEMFQSLIQDGYKVKFITINGLKRLLELKLNKVEERDYQLLEKGISGLKVDEDELKTITQMLSDNWVVHVLGNSDNEQQEIQITLD